MNDMDISYKLNTIKKDIDAAEATHQRLEGQIQAMEETLKRDFNINSWEEAEAEVKRLEEEEQRLSANIRARVLRLSNAVRDYVDESTAP